MSPGLSCSLNLLTKLGFFGAPLGRKVSHLGSGLFLRHLVGVFLLWFLFDPSLFSLLEILYFWFVSGILSSWWLQLLLSCFLRIFFFPFMLEFIRTFGFSLVSWIDLVPCLKRPEFLKMNINCLKYLNIRNTMIITPPLEVVPTILNLYKLFPCFL